MAILVGGKIATGSNAFSGGISPGHNTDNNDSDQDAPFEFDNTQQMEPDASFSQNQPFVLDLTQEPETQQQKPTTPASKLDNTAQSRKTKKRKRSSATGFVGHWCRCYGCCRGTERRYSSRDEEI